MADRADDDEARPSPNRRRGRPLLTIASAVVLALVAAAVAFGVVEAGDGDAETTSWPRRPYHPTSPWNTPLPDDPDLHPDSDELLAGIEGPLTTDTSQYTMPVYEAGPDSPTPTVHIRGIFSDVTGDGDVLQRRHDVRVRMPMPTEAEPAPGSDGIIVVWDRTTGTEWGLWQATREDDGSWRSTNGYRYHTDWSAVPPEGFASRGAGIPYLAGIVRPWEVEQGRIDHALAFGYDVPSPQFVHPATKSDGLGDPGRDLPEGARLQLDPTLTDADFADWGLDRTGQVIARALQEYGMIVVDRSGRAKLFLEADQTAGWGDRLSEETVAGIPIDAFRVLDHPEPRTPPG